MFDYVLNILKSNIPGHPIERQKEVAAVIKILTEGQGYLRKDPPKKVIFYKDIT